MQYAIARGEVFALLRALTLPDELRELLELENIYLSIAIGDEKRSVLNIAAFTDVPDSVLLDLYVRLRRFCVVYAGELSRDAPKRSQMCAECTRTFVSILNVYEGTNPQA